MPRRKQHSAEACKFTTYQYTFMITLPYCITDSLQNQRNGGSHHFHARNDKGDQLNVFGHHLDSEHFTLKFTGASIVDPSSCQLQDSIILSSETLEQKLSEPAISHRSILNQDTTSSTSLETSVGAVLPIEVDTVENSSLKVENGTRKSSRIREKYGEGHSIVRQLTGTVQKAEVNAKLKTSGKIDIANKQNTKEQNSEEAICRDLEDEKLKMNSEKCHNAVELTSQSPVKFDPELPDFRVCNHELSENGSDLIESDVTTSYMENGTLNSQDSLSAAVPDSGTEEWMVSSTAEEEHHLTVSNDTIKFKDELHVSEKTKFGIEKLKDNCDEKPRDSKLIAWQRKNPAFIYRCKLCPHSTACRRNFTSHLTEAHLRNVAQYKREFRLDLHDLTTERVSADFECNICDYSTTRKDLLEKHYTTHKMSENFQLPDIQDTQTDQVHLEHSQDKDTRNDLPKGFPCKLCGSSYSVLTDLSLHIKKKHSQDPQSRTQLLAIQEHRWSKVTGGTPYQCLFCNKSYAGKRVVRHMKLAHSTEPNLENYIKITLKTLGKDIYSKKKARHLSMKVCPHCNKQIKQCSLKRHIDNHCQKNSSIRRRYDCHMCGFYSYDLEDCRQHKATKHAERQTYICETCARSFSTASGLTYHRRVKHGVFKKKPVQLRACPECAKQFQKKSSFDRHLQTHEKYRSTDSRVKCSCHLCGKTFKDKHGVAYHIKTIHEGSYPYNCDQCGHGFGRKSNLLSHQCGRARRITANSLQSKLEEVQNEVTQLEMITVDTIHGMEPSHLQSDLKDDDSEVIQPEIMTKVANIDDIEPNNSIFFSPGALQDAHDMVIIQPSGSGTFTLTEHAEGDDSMYVVVDTSKDGSGDNQPTLVRLTDSHNLDQSGIYTIIEAAADAEF